MTRYRNHRDVYTRDYSRWSIYPRTPRPKEFSAGQLRPGDVISVEVSDIDNDGRGIARYKGYTVKINGGATVGDRARIRIISVRGKEVLANLISVE